MHGFYIEVTNSYRDVVPARYQRRQTLKNAERFITPELKAFEDKALSAQERALQREKFLYEQLLDQLQAFMPARSRAWPRRLRRWTCCAALAERSLTLNWCAPSSRPSPALRLSRAATRWWKRAWPKPPAAAFIANHTRMNLRHAPAHHYRPEHGR